LCGASLVAASIEARRRASLWQDPEGVPGDERAEDAILEMECVEAEIAGLQIGSPI
jgi:hypothetical protein